MVTALRTLRDKLLAEEKEKTVRGRKDEHCKKDGIKQRVCVCVCVAASGQQQHCRQEETSGDSGAAGVFGGAA